MDLHRRTAGSGDGGGRDENNFNWPGRPLLAAGIILGGQG